MAKSFALPDDGRPSVAELHGDSPLAQAAKRWWLREKPAAFKPEVLKAEFYDVLEKEHFGLRSLLVLENLQFLERCVPSARAQR